MWNPHYMFPQPGRLVLVKTPDGVFPGALVPMNNGPFLMLTWAIMANMTPNDEGKLEGLQTEVLGWLPLSAVSMATELTPDAIALFQLRYGIQMAMNAMENNPDIDKKMIYRTLEHCLSLSVKEGQNG